MGRMKCKSRRHLKNGLGYFIHTDRFPATGTVEVSVVVEVAVVVAFFVTQGVFGAMRAVDRLVYDPFLLESP
jgi:hypothetical protein